MVTVKLFGLLKTLASHETDLSVALNGGSRVKDLVAVLQRSYPQISELIQKKTVLVAVNQEIAHEDTEIRDGDEVALLPPFAAGQPWGRTRPATLCWSASSGRIFRWMPRLTACAAGRRASAASRSSWGRRGIAPRATT